MLMYFYLAISYTAEILQQKDFVKPHLIIFLVLFGSSP